ncbi:hypothetical protein FACS189472_11340 [Alphaproteobacteria bacterium]|nr:hypothetical protein FACS189472_11340 [Alphaproteobacteria bacterium]
MTDKSAETPENCGRIEGETNILDALSEMKCIISRNLNICQEDLEWRLKV